MINLVFPIAGEGSRFNGAFKPFLNIGDITFIETTFSPFVKWKDSISTVFFICTREQEDRYDVTEKLKEIIPHPNIKVIVLDEKTSGPYQTVMEGVERGNIFGKTIVCDCDHSLDVDGVFDSMLSDNYDVVVPVWNINTDEWMNWSKVVLDNMNNIKMICEKERIDSKDYKIKGIVGCIGFSRIENFFVDKNSVYVSDALQKSLSENKAIGLVSPNYAHFYGTPEMLESHVNFLRKRCSIFCDIDGVLLKHSPHSSCEVDSNVKLDGLHLLNQWKKSGHKVILTTARNEKYRNKLIKLLEEFNIHYDKLVMSLPAGPRILINDSKPSKIFTPQANAIELERDCGLSGVNFANIINSNDLEVVKDFKGGSFAKTYLVDSPHDDSRFVRKHIIKNHENIIHYLKLKRQMNDLVRFDFMKPGFVPKVISESDSDFSFYFDMEYLDGYANLTDIDFNERKVALGVLLSEMNKFVYSFKRDVNGISWVDSHLENKIFSKFDSYSKKNKVFDFLINSNEVVINSKRYFGLRKLISEIDKHIIKPKFIRPIHGDFTYENVLWNGDDIKIIDMDGSDYFDAAELDLGKMCQSVFSNYQNWKSLERPIYSYNENTFECVGDFFEIDFNEETDRIVSLWQNILNDDRQTVINKGIFYMSMYFIRFVPFRLNVSNEHGIFALIMAIVWISKLLDMENY